MSRTYSAELAPYRLRDLHETYVQRAEELEKIPSRERLKETKYETTCPYCGVRDRLIAHIRVGAKRLVENVRLTESGFEIPMLRDRSAEIVIIHCESCDAAVDPMAYQTPFVFVRDRRNSQAVVEGTAFSDT